MADILLNHGADVELPDNYGQSPLFMACWKGLYRGSFIFDSFYCIFYVAKGMYRMPFLSFLANINCQYSS